MDSRQGVLYALALALLGLGCGDERAIELSLEVPFDARAELCLTAADEGELVFSQSYPAADANGTLTFVAGQRVNSRLRISAVLRRGGREIGRAAGDAEFRAPGLSQIELRVGRCHMTPIPSAQVLGDAPGASTILAGDLDGDGHDEVLASGDAIVVVGGAPLEGSGGARAVSIGDVDGDCLADVIAAGPTGIVLLPSGLLSVGGRLAALGDTGRGRGLATADEDGLRWGPLDGRMLSLTGAPIRDLQIADLDADGTDDLIGIGEGGVEIFFGGDAGPTLAPGATPTGWVGQHGAIGDFDGDGALDLAVADIAEVQVARNRGDGLLEARAPVAFANARGLRVVDVDRDCRDDLIVLGVSAQIFFGAPDASFTPGPMLGPIADAVGADVDGDGARELVLLDSEGRVSTWAP